jgi:putative transposase
MARGPRIDVGGQIYHVINRANGRNTIFHTDTDYAHFENLLFKTAESSNTLCMAYVIMPNHWHVLVKTFEDGSLSQMMRRLTQVHTQHVHVKNKDIGTGHVYQGRFKSKVIDTNNYFLAAVKYIERNPIRASLCEKVEDWRWSSGYHRFHKTSFINHLDADLPLDLAADYSSWINESTSNAELDEIRETLSPSIRLVTRAVATIDLPR